MWIAVKMDCFRPRATECKTFQYFGEVQKLGPEWLVFDGERTDSNNNHPQMAYDDKIDLHLSRPW